MNSLRILTAVLLGIWLGAGILTDIAVTQNFQTVDRFLSSPGSAAASTEIAALGHDRLRALLRRNAGEENNWLFSNWELAELALGILVLAGTLLSGAGGKLIPALAAALLLIVICEHFLLTPEIVELGRRVDGLAPTDPEVGRFWTFHGLYSGLDLLKLAVNGVLIWLVATRNGMTAGGGIRG